MLKAGQRTSRARQRQARRQCDFMCMVVAAFEDLERVVRSDASATPAQVGGVIAAAAWARVQHNLVRHQPVSTLAFSQIKQAARERRTYLVQLVKELPAFRTYITHSPDGPWLPGDPQD